MARDSYKPWNMPPPPAVRPMDVSGATGLPFEGQSLMRSSFPGWAAVPPQRKGSLPYVPNKARFDGRTTYSEGFQVDPEAHASERFKPVDRAMGATGLPFEGTSVMRDDFRKWDARPATPVHYSMKRTDVPETRDFMTELYGRARTRACMLRCERVLDWQC